MFLEHLYLRNIRCLEELDMPLTDGQGRPRKWTLLLGENGTGKSTVLRAIALLLAGSDALPSLIGDSTDSWIRRGAESAEIRATLSTAKDQDREIALRLERGQGIREMFKINSESLDALDQALKHTNRSYFTVGYGVSRRLPVSNMQSSPDRGRYTHPRANSVATLFAPEAELVSLETWATDLHYRKEDQALSLVAEALGGFLPGAEFLTIDREKRQLIFETEDGPMPLALMSDGFQNAISWCGDLLYRLTEVFQDYSNPLRARGLLLIDEIGLHLHLGWQRRLREYISEKFPTMQIVATTHSPFTAHQAGQGELFSLRRRHAPDSDIELLRFEGAPNQLLLHQLIMTPFFGLDTMNSRKWEGLREEYRSLYAKKEKTARDRRKMADLEDQLADQPDWNAELPYYGELSSLLRQIRTEKGAEP
jgi:energy-coupling factor transporter ATP-binding protein EcfA2